MLVRSHRVPLAVPVGLVAVAAMVLSMLVATSANGASTGVQTSAAPATVASLRTAETATRYSPPRGVLFNSPLADSTTKYRIIDHIRKAIRRARPGSNIDIMSWNLMSDRAVTNLLDAQRRGVRVRVLMSRGNAVKVDNPPFRRLVAGLRQGNTRVSNPARRSYARTCLASCRGSGGQAHAKFFLFSHTGAARYVTMQGSSNLTQAAATNQWNDLYTFVGNRTVYDFALRVFNQMTKDQPVTNQFVRLRTGNLDFYFTPFRGPGYRVDPALQLLKQVRCRGAELTSHGRTIVRVAPDVMRDGAGMRYAEQFRRLHDSGCDLKIGYTVMGVDIGRYLKRNGRRGPVPIRHLVQDFDGDKDFDNYFHLKAISINGVIGTNRRAHAVVNGSANLSRLAALSDENITIMRGARRVTLQYQKHIDFWYDNFPRSARVSAAYRGVEVDPYQHVDMD